MLHTFFFSKRIFWSFCRTYAMYEEAMNCMSFTLTKENNCDIKKIWTNASYYLQRFSFFRLLLFTDFIVTENWHQNKTKNTRSELCMTSHSFVIISYRSYVFLLLFCCLFSNNFFVFVVSSTSILFSSLFCLFSVSFVFDDVRKKNKNAE